MVYTYFLYLLIGYGLYRVLIKKEKIMLVLLITPITVVLLKHTPLFPFLSGNAITIITIISVVISMSIFLAYYFLIDKGY